MKTKYWIIIFLVVALIIFLVIVQKKKSEEAKKQALYESQQRNLGATIQQIEHDRPHKGRFLQVVGAFLPFLL